MNQQTFEALEYNAILTQIASYTRTDAGKETVLELKPLENRKQIEAKLAEVMEQWRYSSEVGASLFTA